MVEPNSEIVGTVEGVSCHTWDTRYDLFFTDTAIIAAVVLHPSDLVPLYTKRTRLEGLLLGKGVSRTEVQALSRKVEYEKRQGFKNMTPQEIFRTHRANLKIAYRDILSVKVGKHVLRTTLEVDSRNINGTRTKLRFQLQEGQIESVKRLLNLTLPTKVV